ncbi:phosphoribosyltransferase [Leptospira sp. 201903075]|uniref:phosphoribosyltransferase n=1 Tax=Leptospira chreensis TaxID=2810035 RepID=UPI0019641573|nr:phosphoribosyltransferase [Leptospira chreensis]MBM9590657.1 phosphoribosyltransferase [Leptospira chreensis]
MKYPKIINDKIEEINKIIETWNVQINQAEVIKWILQYDNEDLDIAFRIIKNLNVIGFDELQNALSIAFSKLERKSIDKNTKITSKNTLFAGVGEAGKSGSMISYNFRIINELSEENFLDEESLIHIEEGRVENIVLVDDIISSGDQSTKEIIKLRETLIPLGINNFFLLTALGMKSGIKKVEEETGAHVFSAFEYDITDTINSFDSPFYEGLEFESRKRLKSRLEYYGRICNPKAPLGYGNTGGLTVFYYNTPNSTIPHIWGSLNSWIPLFKRTRKINGIDSYFKQFENLQSHKSKDSKKSKELNIFVEGKNDEFFIECLSDYILAETDYKKLNVISLGSAFTSQKLIDNLNKTQSSYIFLIEDSSDIDKNYNIKINEIYKTIPHVNLKPLGYYFDIISMVDDKEFFVLFQDSIRKESGLIIDRQFLQEFEHRILRRLPPSIRENMVRKLIKNHPSKENINQLVKEIKQAIKK